MVSISYQKSLISTFGSVEFAKMFRVRRLSKDVSNFSIKNLLNENPPCGLFDVYMTYPVIRFSPLCRIGGAVPDFVLLVDSITPVLFTMRRFGLCGIRAFFLLSFGLE